jgi:hypothetical protein
MPKKISVLIIAVGLFFVGTNFAKADSLPSEDDPFWEIVSSLDTPTDNDCHAVAQTEYSTLPLIYGDGHDAATGSCAALAAMMDMATTFTASGIETNLFEKTDWHDITGLYFEMEGFGKIEFSNSIDFLNFDFLTFISTFAERMEMSQGEISLDADIVGGLAGYGAVLTMYNAGNFTDPEILVDGAPDSGGVVSGLTYDPTTHNITFDAAHFTTFKASEKDSDASSHKPRIDDIDIEKYKTSDGVAMVKITLEGKHFKKSTDVTLGGKDASKTTYKSKREIVATFKVKSLLKAGKKELKLKAFNGNKMGKYHKELLLSSLL